MKKLMLVTTLMLAVGSTAQVWADDFDHHGGPDDHGPRPEQRDDHHGRWADEGGPHNFPAPAPYHQPRGFQAGHQWHAGDRLPRSHYDRRYYVDYRKYNLAPPPRGQQWVRVDNDFVLTTIATGVVVDVLNNVLQ